MKGRDVGKSLKIKISLRKGEKIRMSSIWVELRKIMISRFKFNHLDLDLGSSLREKWITVEYDKIATSWVSKR